MDTNEVLAEAEREIRSRCGSSLHCRQVGNTLTIEFVGREESVDVTVCDPERPSFNVSYPGFDPGAASWRDLREQSAEGVLLAGLLWIVEATKKNGAVLPEFPKPGLRARPAGYRR